MSPRLIMICGPCSLETEALSMEVAATIAECRSRFDDVEFIFKGSFDKANRTSLGGKRGPGLEAGLAILEAVKVRHGFRVLTDIHDLSQVAPVARSCDVLQIPAFLCRQTDLLVAAAQTGRIVNVKKGQFLSPYEMQWVVDKLRSAGASEIWQTERGTTFGYQNLVVDMRSFSIMAQNACPTIFDATHSVQLPGAGGGKSAGQREFVPPLAFAALAAGANGLFIETHPRPDEAYSDGPNMVPLAEFPALVEKALCFWKVATEK
jgi:2-dehydro-3-deoxyphosphooctonate aldolase (KDO 8-P synthase)